MNKLVAMDIYNVHYIIRATEEPCFELVKYLTLNKRVDTPSTSYNATGSSSHAEVEPSNREDDDVEVPNGDADVDNNADDFSQTFGALDQREQDPPDVVAVRDGVRNDADPPVTTLNPAIDDYDVGTIELMYGVHKLLSRPPSNDASSEAVPNANNDLATLGTSPQQNMNRTIHELAMICCRPECQELSSSLNIGEFKNTCTPASGGQEKSLRQTSSEAISSSNGPEESILKPAPPSTEFGLSPVSLDSNLPLSQFKVNTILRQGRNRRPMRLSPLLLSHHLISTIFAFDFRSKGNGGLSKKAHVKSLISKYTADIVSIVESKCEEAMFSLIRRIWGMRNSDWIIVKSKGLSGDILAIWNTDTFHVLSCATFSRWIMIHGSFVACDFATTLCFVYGPCDISDQQLLWEEMSREL
ncbi:hypothetical protein GH714_041475 [Hevea brasiliensis]|uniref:Uncharacterized protein n=1 Tax=Hevea brasiliensis TaxID=3981 RepID=A0A6A6MW11_HEVBR|nr:hypothetical protein GH714_041475 [Hevea brasiliensis]